jgi:hypothetical protein
VVTKDSSGIADDDGTPAEVGPAAAAEVAEPGREPGDTQPLHVEPPRDTAAVPTATGADAERAQQLHRLAELEAENARLRAAQAGGRTTTAELPAVKEHRHWGRATGAVVLILVGALLAPAAVLLTWARTTITDTNRYVATVAPLADDPAIQAAVTNRVTGAIVDKINLDQLVSSATDAIANLGLPPRIASLIQGFDGQIVSAAKNAIHTQVHNVVTSDAFSNAWTEANRSAQKQLVGVMRGDPNALASISSNGTLNLDLTPVIDSAKKSLADRGFTIVNSLPTIHASYPLMKNAELVKVKNAYHALDVLGHWLPWVVIALLAAGVLVARHRARALMWAGLSLAAAMLVTGLGIAIGRTLYLQSLPSTIQRPDAAANVYDQIVSFLRITVRTGFVLGIVVALVAFLAGGTAAARAVRSLFVRGTTGARRLGDRHGVGTGPVGVWLYEQRVLVRVVIAVGAALALVLAGHLTPAYIVTVAVIALLVLLLVQLLSRPPVAAAEPEAVPEAAKADADAAPR